MENVLVSIAQQLLGIHEDELEGAEQNILQLLADEGVIESQEQDVNGCEWKLNLAYTNPFTLDSKEKVINLLRHFVEERNRAGNIGCTVEETENCYKIYFEERETLWRFEATLKALGCWSIVQTLEVTNSRIFITWNQQ